MQTDRQIDRIREGRGDFFRTVHESGADPPAAVFFQHAEIHNLAPAAAAEGAPEGVWIHIDIACRVPLIFRHHADRLMRRMIRNPSVIFILLLIHPSLGHFLRTDHLRVRLSDGTDPDLSPFIIYRSFLPEIRPFFRRRLTCLWHLIFCLRHAVRVCLSHRGGQLDMVSFAVHEFRNPVASDSGKGETDRKTGKLLPQRLKILHLNAGQAVAAKYVLLSCLLKGKQSETEAIRLKNAVYLIPFQNRPFQKFFIKVNRPVHIRHTQIQGSDPNIHFFLHFQT